MRQGVICTWESNDMLYHSTLNFYTYQSTQSFGLTYPPAVVPEVGVLFPATWVQGWVDLMRSTQS